MAKAENTLLRHMAKSFYGKELEELNTSEIDTLNRLSDSFLVWVDRKVEKAFIVTDDVITGQKNSIRVGANEMKIFGNARDLYEYFCKNVYKG